MKLLNTLLSSVHELCGAAKSVSSVSPPAKAHLPLRPPAAQLFQGANEEGRESTQGFLRGETLPVCPFLSGSRKIESRGIDDTTAQQRVNLLTFYLEITIL